MSKSPRKMSQAAERTKSTAAFDAEIREAEKHLILLKRKRNATISLGRLPSKIIEGILLYTLSVHNTIHNPYEKSLTSDADWIYVMRVCWQLREVALKSRTLWAMVQADHGNHAWFNLCVARAQEYSVFKQAPGGIQFDREQLLDLTRISHRIRLEIPAATDVQEAQECLDKIVDTLANSAQVPRLTALELYHVVDWPIDNVRVPSRFLGENSTHLTELFLDNIWTGNMPTMISLDRLRMRWMLLGPHCDCLRKLLIRAPNITFLCLEYPKREITETLADVGTELDSISKEAPVELTSLSTVQIIGALTQVGRALYIIPEPSHYLSFRVEEKWDVDQAAKYIKQESVYEDLSRYIYQRMASYTRNMFQIGKLARHKIRVRVVPDINGTVASVAMFPLTKLNANRRGVDFRIIGAPGSYLEDITCYSDDVETMFVSRDAPEAMRSLFGTPESRS